MVVNNLSVVVHKYTLQDIIQLTAYIHDVLEKFRLDIYVTLIVMIRLGLMTINVRFLSLLPLLVQVYGDCEITRAYTVQYNFSNYAVIITQFISYQRSSKPGLSLIKV